MGPTESHVTHVYAHAGSDIVDVAAPGDDVSAVEGLLRVYGSANDLDTLRVYDAANGDDREWRIIGGTAGGVVDRDLRSGIDLFDKIGHSDVDYVSLSAGTGNDVLRIGTSADPIDIPVSVDAGDGEDIVIVADGLLPQALLVDPIVPARLALSSWRPRRPRLTPPSPWMLR